jgi:zinc protease
MNFLTIVRQLTVSLVISLCLPSVISYGAEVFFEENPSLPLINLSIAFKTGVVKDPIGRSGITNFTAEMLLRGTQFHPKEELDLQLDQMGASLDVESRIESIILRGSVLSSQLDRYLALVTEIITQPVFPDQEIIKLKGETVSMIQEELGHDSSLGARAFSKFLFRNHPYGNPVLGKVRDIQKFTPDEIQRHYKALFQDKFLLIVGSGDSSQDKILTWATHLGKTLSITNQGSLEQNPAPVARPQDTDRRRLLIIDKPERSQTQINLGQIGVTLTDPDYFSLYLGNHAIGGPSFSSILMQEIRVKRGWSYGANSNFRHGLQPRSWHAHLFPAAKDTAPALAYTISILENLKKNGITQESFDFSKRSLINSAGFMYNTPAKRVENKLLEKTLNLPEGFMKQYASHLAQLQRDRVNQALKEFLKPDRIAITVVGTAKALTDSLAKAAQISPEQIEVEAYNLE